MSVFVWVMIGVALWHFSVLVPDRFYGGIIGALIAAVGGALASGYLLPSPGVPPHNPPGLTEALWPIPGSIVALLATYLYGARLERARRKAPRRLTGTCLISASTRHRDTRRAGMLPTSASRRL